MLPVFAFQTWCDAFQFLKYCYQFNSVTFFQWSVLFYIAGQSCKKGKKSMSDETDSVNGAPIMCYSDVL